MTKRAITRTDILPPERYAAERSEHRRRVGELKRNRRVEVGPFVTFYFECFETMWLQVQEMLHIERGGDAQLADELAAYNPMIPNGSELSATVMIEIEDPERRNAALSQLGGIEHIRNDQVSVVPVEANLGLREHALQLPPALRRDADSGSRQARTRMSLIVRPPISHSAT